MKKFLRGSCNFLDLDRISWLFFQHWPLSDFWDNMVSRKQINPMILRQAAKYLELARASPKKWQGGGRRGNSHVAKVWTQWLGCHCLLFFYVFSMFISSPPKVQYIDILWLLLNSRSFLDIFGYGLLGCSSWPFFQSFVAACPIRFCRVTVSSETYNKQEHAKGPWWWVEDELQGLTSTDSCWQRFKNLRN